MTTETLAPSRTGPMLATSFFAPRWRAGQVSRPGLVQRLERAVESKLALVCAPAGFGKSTLLAEWLATTERPVAWLSLDETHDDVRTFWNYAISALQRLDSGVGQGALAFLEAETLPPIETLLSLLLNDVAVLNGELTLVLDDYHLIESPAVTDSLAFLIEHLPRNLHIVIATRADPPLRLSSLRARGELTEIRAADLRFSPAEAATFLKATMGLDLTAEHIAALESRTEGWAAALQLAALSMQGRDDAGAFVAEFTGNDRYIVDYLVEEVLQRQAPDVRAFLLRTSVLERFNASLCDALLESGNSRRLLEALERGNLFVVPLDDRRDWFRYHHLFADVLRSHLEDEAPELVPLLHRRASSWFEEHGHRPEAIRSALAAVDYGRAARLVELEAETIVRHHQPARLVDWLRRIPDDVIRSMPGLSTYFGLALQGLGDMEESAARFDDAERLLPAGDQSEAPPAGRQAMDPVRARYSLGRGYLAMAAGDLTAVVEHVGRAMALLPEDEYHWRGTGAALLALAHWARGDLLAAQPLHAAGLESLERAGDSVLAVTSAYADAELLRARGLLFQARDLYERSLGLATARPGPARAAAASLHLGLCDLFCEFNDLSRAERHLREADDLAASMSPPRVAYRQRAAAARLLQSREDLPGALAMLEEAERFYVRGAVPNVRPVGAWKARIKVAQGRLAEALEWARIEGLSAADALEYTREYHHLTLARILIARTRTAKAAAGGEELLDLLRRLRAAAIAGGRPGAVIETLLLEALAHHALRHDSPALASLHEAFALAQPAGYARIFLDEGAPMAELLRRAVTAGVGGEYARELLRAGDEPKRVAADQPAGGAPAEPLTARELEILRLVATGMQNQAIADHLVISLPTVKRHIANVYGKLDVGSRTAAVARAREFKLL